MSQADGTVFNDTPSHSVAFQGRHSYICSPGRAVLSSDQDSAAHTPQCQPAPIFCEEGVASSGLSYTQIHYASSSVTPVDHCASEMSEGRPLDFTWNEGTTSPVLMPGFHSVTPHRQLVERSGSSGGAGYEAPSQCIAHSMSGTYIYTDGVETEEE